MIKFSKNKKLNYVLNDIYDDLMELGKDEIRRYMHSFPNEIDFNIYQYGNMRIYYEEIKVLYMDYKCLKNASINKLINIYKRQVGYMANLIINDLIINDYKRI